MAISKKSESIVISLTDFIDFVSKSGGTKLTKVKQIKQRDKYHPATDFYKPLREHIIDVHREGLGKNDLDSVLASLTDDKKLKNYPDAIAGYNKFWGKKSFSWFEPPSKHWKVGDMDLKINPELGLEYDDNLLVIKLYFKADTLTKDRTSQILSLMESQLRKRAEPGVVFSVLDVKNAKLFRNDEKDTSYLPLLEGEIRSFETIWKAI